MKLTAEQLAEIKKEAGLGIARYGVEAAFKSETILRLLAHIDALEAEQAWVPIADAPKDGTPILVCRASFYSPFTVSWKEYHPNAKGKATWRTFDGMKCEGVEYYKPLPTPPVEGRE